MVVWRLFFCCPIVLDVPRFARLALSQKDNKNTVTAGSRSPTCVRKEGGEAKGEKRWERGLLHDDDRTEPSFTAFPFWV